MSTLTQLVRPKPGASRDEDVEKLRAALNAIGFDATAQDIEWAYELASEEMGARWLTLDFWGSIEEAARALTGCLVKA